MKNWFTKALALATVSAAFFSQYAFSSAVPGDAPGPRHMTPAYQADGRDLEFDPASPKMMQSAAQLIARLADGVENIMPAQLGVFFEIKHPFEFSRPNPGTPAFRDISGTASALQVTHVVLETSSEGNITSHKTPDEYTAFLHQCLLLIADRVPESWDTSTFEHPDLKPYTETGSQPIVEVSPEKKLLRSCKKEVENQFFYVFGLDFSVKGQEEKHRITLFKKKEGPSPNAAVNFLLKKLEETTL